MAGCPTLAVPAGFNAEGLPIGIQIVARNHGERSCLELAHAYEMAANRTWNRLPPLLTRNSELKRVCRPAGEPQIG
jgi:amidase